MSQNLSSAAVVIGSLRVKRRVINLKREAIDDLLLMLGLLRPRGYKKKFRLSSTEHEIQLLIKTKLPTNKEASCFKSLGCCIHPAHKC